MQIGVAGPERERRIYRRTGHQRRSTSHPSAAKQ